MDNNSVPVQLPLPEELFSVDVIQNENSDPNLANSTDIPNETDKPKKPRKVSRPMYVSLLVTSAITGSVLSLVQRFFGQYGALPLRWSSA
jgi:hypothetical protein